MTKSRLPTIALLLVLLAIAAVLDMRAYWPGLMTWDAIRQYDQALSGMFDDWHPPVMEWLWRQMVPLHSGPQPMLVLQQSLYWGGFALLASRAAHHGRRWLAVAIAACAFNPIALGLIGAVLKDCLMAGALLAAAGLLAWVRDRPGWGLRLIGIGLLLFAAMLRFNAFLACLPLFVGLLPRRWRSTAPRLAASAVGATLLLVAAMPLANRAIGAERSGVELSLIIFDLGGIGYHSGTATFPDVGVADPVRVNNACYRPIKWDPYSWWVDEPCPIGFEALKARFDRTHESATGLWLRTVLAHPIAYAEHRLAHFAINARIVTVPDSVERPLQVESAPNDWHYRVTPSRELQAIDRAAIATAHTPFGWPIVWMGVALGVLILTLSADLSELAPALAASSLLYGLGYLVFSVAAELRYHLWTIVAATLAAILCIADRRWRRVSRARLIAAGAPVVTAVVIAGVGHLG